MQAQLQAKNGPRHTADRVDEVARDVRGFAGLDLRHLRQQFTEDRTQLRPCHVCAEAEVSPATAEPEAAE